jgi:hypothetical protein
MEKKRSTIEVNEQAGFYYEGVWEMIRDEYAVKLDSEDLQGRKQVWIHCEGQTIFVAFEPKRIQVMGWVDRPIRRKTYKINQLPQRIT